MCGIAGVMNNTGAGKKEIQEIESFNRAQKHRGPDDEGVFHDATCVLGHVRLAIIDLSRDGRQPFRSDDGRYWLTFNGEIYNYIELREELKQKGHVFKTKTDTEVLLKSYIEYGASCLEKFNGMFAFGIYDSQKKELFLARDRFGVKPLYYMTNGASLYFSSEIKALRSVKGVPFRVNEKTLFDYLCFNRTDIFDETFDTEIKRLPKGHYGIFDASSFRIASWWDPKRFSGNIVDISEADICKKIEEIVVSAVSIRMRSDVSIGSCLSGGLDSSIILGIVYRYFSPKHYETFTASFPGYRLDESSYIELLAKKYPFENHRTTPSSESALKNLNDFVHYNDEPVTSPTFYSQYEVMRLARERGVTVLLDGQGGDENFAGYHYFHGFHFTGLLRKKRYLKLLREVGMSLFRKQDREAFETFGFQLLPESAKKFLLLSTLPHIHHDFFHEYVGESVIYREFFAAQDLNESIANHFRYKLEHLLRTEDRNSMAFHIETRLPYLDYRLVEFLLGVPEEYKIRRGENKLLQKKALGAYTIPEILERKDKIGFGTPGEEWMRTPEWEEFTREHYSYLSRKFPNIFEPDAELKYNLYDRWKINQLALWHQKNY